MKKAILEVPNAPAVMPVKRERGPTGLVNHVGWVISVNPTIQTLLRARHANRGITNKRWAKRLVCRAFPARMKMIPVLPNVKNVALGNTKMHLAMTRV